jgi:hypothetical protein
MIQLPGEPENVADADKPHEFLKYTGQCVGTIGHWDMPSRLLEKIAKSKVFLIEGVQIFNFIL